MACTISGAPRLGCDPLQLGNLASSPSVRGTIDLIILADRSELLAVIAHDLASAADIVELFCQL